MNRIIPLALATLVATAGLASAENAFSLPTVQPRDNIVELGTVTTDGPGMVQIYGFHDGKVGDLMGTHDLLAGANEDVKVSLNGNADGEAFALLLVGDKIVAAEPVRFEGP